MPKVEYTDELKILRQNFSTHVFFQTISWLLVSGALILVDVERSGFKKIYPILMMTALYALIALCSCNVRKTSCVFMMYTIYSVSNIILIVLCVIFFYEYAIDRKGSFIKQYPDSFSVIFLICAYLLYCEVMCLQTLMETCRAIRQHRLKYRRQIEDIYENISRGTEFSQII